MNYVQCVGYQYAAKTNGTTIYGFNQIIEDNVLDNNNSYDHIDWKLTMIVFSLLSEFEPS